MVIIGAGFGGLAAAQALGGTDVAVSVVDRLNYHLFQPLLYQVALAGLSATDVAYPIRRILRHHTNIEVLLDEVRQIDLPHRRVRLADGIELAYDYLIVAAGAETSYFGHDDWAPIAPGLKDLDDALEVRRRVLTALEGAERTDDPEEKRRLLTFVVVGGGPTGVELAGAIADLSREILHADFRRVKPSETRVVLVEMADRILLPFEPKLSESARLQLGELGVDVRLGVRVERIDDDGVLVGGEVIRSRTVLWAAGVRPSPLAAALGTPRDRLAGSSSSPTVRSPATARSSSSATWRRSPRRAPRRPFRGSARLPFKRGAPRPATSCAPKLTCRRSRSITSTRGSWRRSARRGPSRPSAACG